MGLLLILSRCEQNPIITDLPGSQWKISDTTYSVLDTVLVRTPEHGDSHTLYTGLIDEDEPDTRESGILIKFASVDCSRMVDFKSARLVLFRRTFGQDMLPDSSLVFNLSTIGSATNDTIWTESDTAGHIRIDLLETTWMSTALMSMDSIATPSGDSIIIRTDLEYLAFQVDSTILSDWCEGEVANNGFLIQQGSLSDLVGFHSSESNGISPFLALTIKDTTSTGGDTTYYKWSTADLSIYTWPNPNFDPTDSDSSLHLDHSSGVRSHIHFGSDFDLDTTGIITGARLTLYLNDEVEVSPIVADQVDIQVRRRARPLAQGDSTEVLISRVIYQGASNSLSLNLGFFLSGVATGAYMNYGLDLVVIPNNHDFDHLVFWGSSAPDSLKRPRLEIIYSSLYKEVP